MRPARSKPKHTLSATTLAFIGAACWACLTVTTFLAGEASRALLLYGALGFGPVMLVLFAALAAREATRTRVIATRIADLTEIATIAPSPELVAEARELAQTLREEIEALDAVVHTTARRLDAFENGLRTDGGLLARALVDDLNTMGRVRQDLNEGTLAIGEAIGRHVAALRETSDKVREETTAAAETFGAQLQAFGAISATLGARSAEFAAAANASTGSAQRLDAAVEKSLKALSQATSMTETARKSAAEAISVAQDTAGAVRTMTRAAVTEVRDSAKRVRTETAPPRPTLPRIFGGALKAENIAPPILDPKPIVQGEVIAMPAPAVKAEAASAVKVETQPAVKNETAPVNLADIVMLAGVDIATTLSSEALDAIAQAARGGAQARRDAVRQAALADMRKISAYLRRDANARRDAEALRREPGRALGAPGDDAMLRRKLACAYLLIDAVLG